MVKETNKAKILQLAPELPHKFTHVRSLKGWAGQFFPNCNLFSTELIDESQPVETRTEYP